MKYVIWDLDNCLSNDEWRLSKIDWTKKNPDERYAAYHAAGAEDKPGNTNVFHRLHANHADTCRPIFFTARPVSVRDQTEAWIKRELGVTEFVLVMRNNGDHRSSVGLKCSMLAYLPEYNVNFADVIAAYDDREDIVQMYNKCGMKAQVLAIHDKCAMTPPAVPPQPAEVSAADILASMAHTYRERNAIYGSNFKMVAKLMAVLFPNGVPPELVVQDQFHLFELVLVKLSRYAISNLTHIDSAHDAAVYMAMCEAINQNSKESK